MKPYIILITLILSFMSEIVAQNPGDVVFSSSPINPLNPVSLQTEFSAGDYLYAVAYLPQPVKEIYDNSLPNAKLEVEVFIYEIKPPLYSYQQPMEEQLTFASMWVTGSVLDNKFLIIDLIPDPARTTAYGNAEISYKEFGKKFDGPVNFTENLAKLADGEHNLKVLVKCYYNDAASGLLKISGNEFSKYQHLSEELNMTAQSAGSKNTFLPIPLKSDPSLEVKMKAAILKSNDWAIGRWDAAEIIQMSIIDADWYIRRHEITGAILHRYIRAAVAVKTRDSKCAYYLATFQEDYIGGTYQPLHYDGMGDKIMMDCANLR